MFIIETRNYLNAKIEVLGLAGATPEGAACIKEQESSSQARNTWATLKHQAADVVLVLSLLLHSGHKQQKRALLASMLSLPRNVSNVESVQKTNNHHEDTSWPQAWAN